MLFNETPAWHVDSIMTMHCLSLIVLLKDYVEPYKRTDIK